MFILFKISRSLCSDVKNEPEAKEEEEEEKKLSEAGIGFLWALFAPCWPTEEPANIFFCLFVFPLLSDYTKDPKWYGRRAGK